MNRTKWIAALAAMSLSAAGALVRAETVECKATRDVWISAMGKEVDYNMGAAPSIKLKVCQEFGLADFDVAALKGQKIVEAHVYVRPAGGHKFGLNGGTDLKWLTLSTVSQDWVEGKSGSYAADSQGNGATFNESSYQRRNWGFEGAKAWDAILGNGNTLRFDGPLEPCGAPRAGWLRAKIDPRLVQALLAGASHGLLLMDGSTTVGVNCTIKSRESGQGPFLEVRTDGADTTPPAPPAGLQVKPAPNWAGPDLGAAEISLRVPAGAFAYKIKINGRQVQRWQIPFAAAAGQAQTFPILDLAPGSSLRVEVAAVDAAGNESPTASAQGKASPKLTVPDLPAYPFKPRAGDAKTLGAAKVWAFPEITKVDPVDGKVLNEKVGGDLRNRNAVWDGAAGTIRLAAARGEIVSFQIAVEGKTTGCKVEVSSLRGPGEISNKGVKLWRNWYVRRHSEYAIALKPGETFDVPSKDNGVADQKLQAVTVDIHVPRQTRPGDHEGKVTVSAGGEKAELKLKVKVYDVTIPDEIHFNPELNCYGGPGQAGSEQFKDSFRLAHYHRCTINRVPYSQGGSVHDDWAPGIDAGGRVVDWSNFDNNLGGLLDGTWFQDNPRAGVPVPALYLPFFEGWPKDFRKHYHPGQGVPTNFKDPDQKLRHDTLAKPVDEAFDQAFKDAFVACATDFRRHFTEKKWNRTLFQFYLNNKPNYGYTAWTLDEPYEYLDWAALNFFAGLWKQAVDDPDVFTPRWQQELFARGLAAMNRPRPTLLFRGDISRPMWQGSVSDGLMNVLYVGGAGYEMPRLLRNMRLRAPMILCTYGSANAFGRSNWESAAWCLKAYVNNSDGVLPWQSLGGAGALTRGDTSGSGNALIINAGKYGHAVASFRVHAFRRGAQDCELLRLLQLKKGWSREHVGLLVSQRVPMAARFKQAFPDEAGAVTFGTLTGQGFCELKEGILQLLVQKN